MAETSSSSVVLEATESSGDVITNGSSQPSSRKKQRIPNGQKTCRVCGDCALAHNFDVISCESCKAFFRRNALKPKIKPCAFNGNCDITPETRRFCCQCRLRKCLASGMKPEMILDDDKRKALQDKIAENRRKKEKHNTRPQDVSTSSSRPDHVTSAAESHTSSSSQSASEPYPDDVNMAPTFDVVSTKETLDTTNSSFQFPAENSTQPCCRGGIYPLEVATKELSLLDFTNLLPEATAPSGVDLDLDLGESFHHVRHEQLPSDLRRYWRLSDEERALLADLTVAYQETVLKLPENISTMKPVNVQSILYRCQRYANDMVNFVKRVADFRALRMEDQLATLKGSSWRTFLIKGAANFVVESHAWMKDDGYLSVEQFVQASPEHRDRIHLMARYCSSLKQIIRSDLTVFALLQVLVLFDPRDPQLTDRQQVAQTADRYALLLKHYLESQWSYDHAGHYLAAIRDKLQQLPSVAGRVQVMFVDWLDMLQPLMRELLNLA